MLMFVFIKTIKCDWDILKIKCLLFSLFALSLEFLYHHFMTVASISHQFESLKPWTSQQRVLEHKGNLNPFLSLNILLKEPSSFYTLPFKMTVKQILLACNDHLLKSLTFTYHFSLFSCSSPPGGRWCRACGSTVPQSPSSSSSPSVLMDQPQLPRNLLNLRASLEEEANT